MKRILVAACTAAFGVLFIWTSGVLAQDGSGGGFPPPTEIFNDALLLARALPFVVALGIAFGIWQGKVTMRQPKSAPDSPHVIRHDFGAVVAHWVNGIGFMVAMLTGAFVLRWIARPDEMRAIFALHYVAAALILFGMVSHMAQNAVTGGTGLLLRSFKEVLEGIGELIEYTGIFGPAGAVFRLKLPKGFRDTFAETFRAFGIAPPKRLGKYLPAEKLFSYLPWAIIVVVLVVTGLVKSFRHLYAVPPNLLAQATSIHDLFAIVAVVMFVLHIVAVSFAPRNWPLLGSIFTTRVSRKHVQQWHPAWFKELIAEENAASRPAPQATAEKSQAQAAAE